MENNREREKRIVLEWEKKCHHERKRRFWDENRWYIYSKNRC